MKTYYVYIMTNHSKTLYTGMTLIDWVHGEEIGKRK